MTDVYNSPLNCGSIHKLKTVGVAVLESVSIPVFQNRYLTNSIDIGE